MNANLIPDLPFKFKITSGQTWTVEELIVGQKFNTECKVVRDYDGASIIISVIELLTKLKSGDWKIIKEEKVMKKIKTTDLKGFVADEHQPYTDYSQEIADWLTENADSADFTSYGNTGRIFTLKNGEFFYAHYSELSCDVYYTNEEFKEWIGMTKKEEKYMNEMPKLVAGKHWVVVENEGYGGIGLITINNMIHYIKGEDGAVSTGFDCAEDVSEYIVEVREIPDDAPPTFRCAKTVWKKVDQKQLAIQKELELAKAKAERLAAHISVLESKFK